MDKDNPRKVSYRFDEGENILQARESAVQRALLEKKRLNKLIGFDNSLIGRIKLCLEYQEIRPDENPSTQNERHYILDGADGDYDHQLFLLEYESVLFQAAEKQAKIIDVEGTKLPKQMIEQYFKELVGFYDDVYLTDALKGKNMATRDMRPHLSRG
jgi:hypothetical protein